jgi:hypothetical protein
MQKPLLLDVGGLSCGCTDHVLETLHKATAETPTENALWRSHEDRFISEHIDSVTGRIQARLLAILNALLQVHGILDPGVLAKARPPWLRWDADQAAAVRAYIEAKNPDDYTLDDWLLVAEMIINQYLPDGVLAEEAQYLAVRSALLGKIKQHSEASGVDYSGDMVRLSGLLPHQFTAVRQGVPLSDIESLGLEFAVARAGELVSDLSDAVRRRVKAVIIEHQQGMAMGEPGASLWSLQSSLLDEFGILNRDWRRVALTEAGRNANEGYIAALPTGARVRRVEAYEGACSFCRAINGRVFTVVDPGKKDKDGATEVWVGKTNVGRSASPRKRVNGELVERLPSELWWVASGVQHPNCRGGWSMLEETPADVAPEFAQWMDELLGDHGR